MTEWLKIGRRQQIVDTKGAFLCRLAEQPAEEVDVLEDRKRRIEVLAKALRQVGDARSHAVAERRVIDVAAKDSGGALLQFAHARGNGEQGGLADTVWPDHADHAAGWNVERHIVERHGLSVSVRDVPDAHAWSI